MENTFVWLELASDDTKRSKDFYSELFGWSFAEHDATAMMEVGDVFHVGSSIKENPGRGHIPSHWTPFVRVDDVIAATQRCQQLGATVLYDVHELPDGHGHASTVLDPAGAPLSLWQASGQAPGGH